MVQSSSQLRPATRALFLGQSRLGARLVAGLLGAFALLATAVPAYASDNGADMNVLKVSGHKDDILGVQSTQAWKQWEWTAGLWFDYIHGALAAEDPARNRLAGLVKDQVFADAFGSVGVTDWLSIAVHVPVLLYGSGDTLPSSTGMTTLTGAGLGDIRLGARWSIIGGKRDGFGLALAGDLSLPTATSDKFAGTVGVAGTPTLVADYAKHGWLASVNAGFHLRKTQFLAGHELGNELLIKAGLAAPVSCGKFYVLGTLEGRTNPTSFFSSRYDDGLDGAIGLRAHVSDFAITAAGAGGFLNGAGSPIFRGSLALQYWPAKSAAEKCEKDAEPIVAAPIDTDHDGIADVDDKCPTEAGLAEKQGCPNRDKDGDGILDADDACVDVPGVASAKGCPDKDGDGVRDSDDACIDVPGKASAKGCPDEDGDSVMDAKDRCPKDAGLVALEGCPDQDGDQIADIDDKCPDRRGKKENGGCPDVAAKAVVTKEKIEILEVVHFDTGKSTIQKTSDALLKEVATLFAENLDIKKVRIEGHTDNAGKEDDNLKLSQGRADAVKARLVSLGIDAGRLDSKGFGPSKPIADNKTKAGKAKNRRVEFVIVERKLD